MPQLYCQLASRPSPWLLGRTSAGLCTLQTACPLTVTYSGGSPAADTIAAGSAATVYGGSAATFDAQADVWVVLTVPASGALQVVKEADLATVSGDWAGLARIAQHSTEPYQPQAYLGAGGVGSGSGATVTTVVVSAPLAGAVGAKALSLWNGSSNNSPPANWYGTAYDDSAWAAALAATAPTDVTCPGSTMIWPTALPPAATDQALFRQHFTLPAGTPSAATLQIDFDDALGEVYLNGTLLTISGHIYTPGTPESVPPGLLHPLATNLLAVRGINTTPGGSAGAAMVSYRLEVTQGGTGVVADPGGSEGDLLYYHSGAWTDLPIGTTGQELTVVSGDPAWATPPAGYTDPLTTKGDLLTRSASATVRLGVGSNGQVVTADSTATDGITWATPASSGVTSIAVAVPAPLSSAGGPITSSGTITLSWASGQTANRVLASPDGTSGAVSLRALVAADIPSLPASQITSGQLQAARGGTGLDTSAVTDGQLLIGQTSDHTFGLAALTAGSGVTITNAGHGITIAASGGSGTVTSVALSLPGIFTLSGSPITTSGTFSVTLANESVATVFAGPAAGSAAAPTFRALAASDLPAAAAAGGHIHAHGHFL